MNTSVTLDLPGEASVQLRNRWLAFARVVWACIFVLALGIFLAAVPVYLLNLGVLTEIEQVHLSYLGLAPEFAALRVCLRPAEHVRVTWFFLVVPHSCHRYFSAQIGELDGLLHLLFSAGI